MLDNYNFNNRTNLIFSSVTMTYAGGQPLRRNSQDLGTLTKDLLCPNPEEATSTHLRKKTGSRSEVQQKPGRNILQLSRLNKVVI
jgi:hypothetical protein